MSSSRPPPSSPSRPPPSVAYQHVRVPPHPSGNEIGGKCAGLEALGAFSAQGVFKNIVDEMGRDSRFRSAPLMLEPFVPTTFALPSGHYKSYIGSGPVAEAIKSGRYEQIAEAIGKTDFTDPATRAAIGLLAGDPELAGVLAIRSSASCEDRSQRSPFAGDFETVFRVSTPQVAPVDREARLSGAIREVYLSMFAPRVQAKMTSLGLNPPDHHMSVAIQRVVGDTIQMTLPDGEHELHFPMLSAVLASRSIGMRRPDGVGRDAPFSRLGFGLGTVVVDGEGKAEVPCTILFPDLPRLSVPTSFSETAGQGEPRRGQAEEFIQTQDRFDAVDIKSGKVLRVPFSALLGQDNYAFLQKYRLALSLMTDEQITFGQHLDIDRVESGSKRDALRATLSGLIASPQGKLLVEFLGRVARKMKDMCGFAVDMEFAVRPVSSAGKLQIGILQLRPFGSSGDSVELTDVSEDALVARTADCIGNGKQDFENIVIVTDAVSRDIPRAEDALSKLDQRFRGKYVLIGPNITAELGRGGVYGMVFNAGAIVSYPDSVQLENCGTHIFNNIAMMRVIEGKAGEVKKSVTRLLAQEPASGSNEISPGVFLIRKKTRIELDDQTGRGQLYILEGED